MRRFLYIIILFTLPVFVGMGQNRNKKVQKPQENVNYAAETDKLLKSYDIDAATNMLDRWEKWLNYTNREFPSVYDDMRARAINTKNLLERVEKIELIDTLLVDSVDFFANYLLSPYAGDLLDALSLPEQFAAQKPKVVYQPQNCTELFWAMPVGKSRTKIVVSQILDDGTITEPESIGDAINDIGSTDYPFVQDDGMTIYFAAKGDNSLGGYDIFMTRRGADGELMQPQNIGMPYNSPYNDFMMVIDDARNLGWWASDRNCIPGKLTIYVFRPSAARVNYNSDSEDLIDNALLRNQRLKGGLDALLTDKVTQQETEEETFVMSMGNGKVYTSLSDFQNPAARKVMEELQWKFKEKERLESELANLRIAYGKGNKKKGQEIKDKEKRLEDVSANIRSLSNRVVSSENK